MSSGERGGALKSYSRRSYFLSGKTWIFSYQVLYTNGSSILKHAPSTFPCNTMPVVLEATCSSFFFQCPCLRTGTIFSCKSGSIFLSKPLSPSVYVVNSSTCQCKHCNQWSCGRIWKSYTEEILCWQSIKICIVKTNFCKCSYYFGMALYLLIYIININYLCIKVSVPKQQWAWGSLLCTNLKVSQRMHLYGKKLKVTPEELLYNVNRQSKRATWQSRERKRTVRWNIKVEQSQHFRLFNSIDAMPGRVPEFIMQFTFIILCITNH